MPPLLAAVAATLIIAPAALAQTGLPLTPAIPINAAAADNNADSGVAFDTDRTGHWVATWTTDRLIPGSSAGRKVVVSRSADDAATWSSPAWFPAAPGGAIVRIASNRAGRWLAVWSATTQGETGPTGDTEVFTASSDDDGATWSGPRTLNTDAAAETLSDTVPAIAGDSAGRWIAAWRRGGTGVPGRLFTASSTDNGLTWTAPTHPLAETITLAGNLRVPALATDGSGTWVLCLALNNTTLFPGEPEADAVVAISSTNGGQTWSAPAALMAYAESENGILIAPTIATDRQGRWIACWSASIPGSTPTDAGSYDLYISRSTDNAATWDPVPLRMNTNNLADFWEFDLDPVIASAGSGRWSVAWKIWRDLRIFPIYGTTSNDDGLTWSASTLLSSTTNTFYASTDDYPAISAAQSGAVVLAWNSVNRVGGAMTNDPDVVMRTLPAGASAWTPIRALDPTAAIDGASVDHAPAIAADDAGRVVAVWTSTADGGLNSRHDEDIFTARSGDSGLTWSTPAALNSDALTDTPSDREPAIATDGAGVWIAAWAGSVEPGAGQGRSGIIYSRSTDHGASWSASRLLNDPIPEINFDTDSPAVATTRTGIWIIASSSDDWLDGSVGLDREIEFQRSTDGGLTWSPTAPLNTDAVEDAFDDSWPSVACSSAGVCTAVWSRSPVKGSAAHYSLVHSRSADGGLTWSPPAPLPPGPAASSERNPSITTDGRGGWIVVSRSLLPTTATIVSRRSTDNGLTFSAPITLPLPAPASGSNGGGCPAITTDTLGSWVVTANLGGAISSIRSINDGLTWTPPVALVAVADPVPAASAYAPTVAADRLGRFILAWPAVSTGLYGADVDLYSTTFTIPDCNNNGLHDPAEIVAGTLPDCNGNGLPDLCELSLGNDFDCNANTVPDSCDIARGHSRDLNNDAVPDSCQCAPDLTGDGLLSVQDLLQFLGDYFARLPAGDFNRRDSFTTQDIFDFLQWYFEGCAP